MDGYMVWEAPDGRMSILVSRQALAGLQDLADEGAGATLVGRAERMEESGRRVVTIESFESGIARLYDPAVVGFVRCRRQTVLHLNDAEYRILKDAPDLVCLMIRPDGSGDAIGGFFYREGRTIRCPSPALQFPISADALDCKGMLCVKEQERAEAPQAEAVAEEPRKRFSVKRLLYAAAGLVFLLSPVAIWRAMQHDSGAVAPAVSPARESTGPAPSTPGPPVAATPVAAAPRVQKTQAPRRLAHHGRLRRARNLSKHVR